MRKIIVVLALIAIVGSGLVAWKTVGASSRQSSQSQKAVDVRPADGGCGPVGSSGQACPMVWGGGGGTGVHGVVLM